MLKAEYLHDQIADLDVMDAIEAKFDAARREGGLAWAIECCANDAFYARQMARIVRPLLEAYNERSSDEGWIAQVRQAREEASRRLFQGHWRHNSTSMLQNLQNEVEAEAMSRFLQRLEYIQ